MDYEKAYKEMVQRAKELHESGNELTKKQMEIVCPELAESEDEKIRKALLRCCDDWDKGQFGCMAKEDVPAIRAYLEKQKEQKPAKWSEEDERLLRTTLECLNYVSCQSKIPVVNWLKSLPERFNLQPKQEWSEEDETIKTELLELISSTELSELLDEETQAKLYHWIEEKYGCFHWKPSEEQMDALERCVDYLDDSDNEDAAVIGSLCHDLKML